MKSLVVGLGIGKLYVDVLTKLGADVVTVDTDATKNPTFTNFKEACASGQFDTVHICTPNFTHEDLFYEYIKSNPRENSIVFVEKPGFKTAQRWQKACEAPVKLMMVKNNQYRDNIEDMIADSKLTNFARISWINYNRVPNPGSWFTTKELAWGGVSRDLMPHLLSYLPMFEPENFRKFYISRKNVQQRSKLKDLISSDYGNVNPNGIYDVDDFCSLELVLGDIRIWMITDWRSMSEDDVSLSFGNMSVYALGLCPEEAYSTMIENAITHRDNSIFWNSQRLQDIWIHKTLEEIDGA